MRQVDGDPPEPPLIVERAGQALGLPEVPEQALDFAEREERRSQVEAKIDGLL